MPSPYRKKSAVCGTSHTAEKLCPDAPTNDVTAGYAVLSVRPSGEGETVAVVLSVPSENGDGDADRKPTRLLLHLLVEQYADLSPREGRITAEESDALLSAGRLCAAIKRGMNLLQYGDMSARRLAYKLTAKGIRREVAEAAAAYLTEKGYIREDSAATLRAAADARKGWGLRRIREDLRANGFTPDAVEEAIASLADMDFEEHCASLIRKKYRPLPVDRAAKQKMVASLMRMGYDTDTIRAAVRCVESEQA